MTNATWVVATATAAALMLTACGGSGTNAAGNATANQANAMVAAANGAADAKDPAAAGGNAQTAAPEAAATGRPSATASSPSAEIRALLIGRWAEDGNCAAATEIRADGTFAAPSGSGRWTLESEYLSMSGNRDEPELAVQEIDGREMATVNPNGHIGHWTRC